MLFMHSFLHLVLSDLLRGAGDPSAPPLNPPMNVKENRVSISGSYLYIAGYVLHFWCWKANLSQLNKFVFLNSYETNFRLTLSPH